MGSKTSIEWTEASWTPIRARNKATGKVGWHCEHASPGCINCYAESLNRVYGSGLPFKPGHRDDIEVFLDEKLLTDPLRWKRGRMVFVCSMTDLFADFVPDEWIDRIFAVMALCPQHTFQVLTKRSARMRDYVGNTATYLRVLGDGVADELQKAGISWNGDRDDRHSQAIAGATTWPLPNVWLGVSAEDQARADERVPDLLATPAAIRFVSAEPLLGPINFRYIVQGARKIDALNGNDYIRRRYPDGGVGDFESGQVGGASLDWIIVGGESGRDARPMHPAWARSIRDQCAAASVAFHFKQWGEWAPSPEGDDSFEAFKARGGRDYIVLPPDGVAMDKLGKKAAGRLLDGVEHNGFPAALREVAA